MKPLHSLLLVVVAAAAGWFAARHASPHSQDNGAVGRRVSFYQSPMHPWVKSDQPGKCTVCGMDLVPVYEGDAGFNQPAASLVMLPRDSPNVMGVQTSEVRKQPLRRTLRVAGMIGEDMSRHGVISAPVEGRVDGLSTNHEGQQVTRRQPLATIFSRTLLGAAHEYAQAFKLSSEAAEPARRRLEQYGLVWEQISGIPQRQPDDLYFGILSPLSGVIVKTYISEGEYVKEGQKLFEVADFTKMWFMFHASVQDLSLLKIGQPVTLTTAHLPGQTFHAPITSINPNLDAMTRSAMVRVVLENPDRVIRNNSFAEGTVEIEEPEILALPRAAILWSGARPRVYVEKATGSYEQRQARLGRVGDVLWEVLDGLQEGERVVTNGAMLIDSQAQLDAMAARPETSHGSQPDVLNQTVLRSYMKAVDAFNAALARDDLTAANAALQQLPPAPGGVVKTAAPPVNTDLTALRQAFLPWSQDIVAVATKFKLQLPDLHIFRCSMTDQLWPGAPANAGWIQFSPELRNPYWGREMQECGTEVMP